MPDAPTEYSVPHNHTVVERVEVAGHTTELTQSRVGADGGLSAKAAVVNDAASPAGTWGLDTVAPFFVVVRREVVQYEQCNSFL